MHDVTTGQASAGANDLQVLQQLNCKYVRSAEQADVGWYAENLAEDFLSSSADGSIVDRARFLARAARPYAGTNLEAKDVRIRILGEIAIIHAGFRYTRLDGAAGSGRYTDIWARRATRWLCVSAHFNRF